MLGGTELIRRKLGKDAYAMTITLLLNSEGKKMGKTQKGAVWLDPEQDHLRSSSTSTGEMYADADVLKVHPYADLPCRSGADRRRWTNGKEAQLNQAKEILAYELTKLVHGEEEAKKARGRSARALFTGGNAAEMPDAVSLTEA